MWGKNEIAYWKKQDIVPRQVWFSKHLELICKLCSCEKILNNNASYALTTLINLCRSSNWICCTSSWTVCALVSDTVQIGISWAITFIVVRILCSTRGGANWILKKDLKDLTMHWKYLKHISIRSTGWVRLIQSLSLVWFSFKLGGFSN